METKEKEKSAWETMNEMIEMNVALVGCNFPTIHPLSN